MAACLQESDWQPKSDSPSKIQQQIFRLQLRDLDWLQRKPAEQAVHFFSRQRHLLLRKGKEVKGKNGVV